MRQTTEDATVILSGSFLFSMHAMAGTRMTTVPSRNAVTDEGVDFRPIISVSMARKKVTPMRAQ